MKQIHQKNSQVNVSNNLPLIVHSVVQCMLYIFIAKALTDLTLPRPQSIINVYRLRALFPLSMFVTLNAERNRAVFVNSVIKDVFTPKDLTQQNSLVESDL